MDLAALMEESETCQGLLDSDDDEEEISPKTTTGAREGVNSYIKDSSNIKNIDPKHPKSEPVLGFTSEAPPMEPNSDELRWNEQVFVEDDNQPVESVQTDQNFLQNKIQPPDANSGSNDSKPNTNIFDTSPEEDENPSPQKKKKEINPAAPSRRSRRREALEKRKKKSNKRRRNQKTIVKERNRTFELSCLLGFQICLCCLTAFVLSATVGCVAYLCSIRTTHKKSRKCGCYNLLFSLCNICFQCCCIFITLFLLAIILAFSPFLLLAFFFLALVVCIVCCPCITIICILCFPCILVFGICFLFVFSIILVVLGFFLIILLIVVTLFVLVLCCVGAGCGIIFFPVFLIICAIPMFALLLPACFPIIVMVFYGLGANAYCLIPV